MQIICISRGSQSLGAEFAGKLASKLGYECISREQLLEEAPDARIPVGKLETAIIKPHIFSEDLALDMDHFKALATSILCERALKNSIVYHGRTGHLLLPGIDHILRIRVVSDIEYRLQHVMRELGLSRAKARQYIEQVEDDRRKWVKKFYNVDWDVFTLYDLIVNLSQVNVDNAASAVCSLALLPEFRATPASINALEDLHMAAKGRLMLASDTRTRRMNVKVRANNRVVYVTYLSQELKEPRLLTEVLGDLAQAREIICTRAETNILWIQETFELSDRMYKEVLGLAKAWDAAVELLKVTPTEEPERVPAAQSLPNEGTESWPEAGIIDDSDEREESASEDVSKVYEDLINDGRAGGKRVIYGGLKTLVKAIDRSVNYRLIIFDNVFLSKGAAAQTRLRQEWSNLLSDSLRKPVVTLDEIVSRYHFGPKHALKMLVCGVLVTLVLFAVFHFDREILSFLSREGLKWRILSTLCIVVFVPFFALAYSTVTSLFLKMIKLD